MRQGHEEEVVTSGQLGGESLNLPLSKMVAKGQDPGGALPVEEGNFR